MRTHEEIDRRSLELARAVVSAIDGDPTRTGLLTARANCERWYRADPSSALAEWREILKMDWDEIRRLLLADGDDARRLRQSSPFCGVLSPRDRWAIYRRFAQDEPQTA